MRGIKLFVRARQAIGRRLVLGGVIIALGAFALGFTSAAAPRLKGVCEPRIQERLFFGLSSPDGPIPEGEWEAFVENVVTPRFPAGLTIVEATGQWQSGDKRVTREDARVLEIIHDRSSDASRRIAEIASEYKARYRQDSVLIARARVEVCP